MPKSKQQKVTEAVARNEKHRAKYEAQAVEKFPTDVEAQREFVDMKIGIPAKKKY